MVQFHVLDLILYYEAGKCHPPLNPQRWLQYWNTLLKLIRLWADIDRNCNTFLIIKWLIKWLPAPWHFQCAALPSCFTPLLPVSLKSSCSMVHCKKKILNHHGHSWLTEFFSFSWSIGKGLILLNETVQGWLVKSCWAQFNIGNDGRWQ